MHEPAPCCLWGASKAILTSPVPRGLHRPRGRGRPLRAPLHGPRPQAALGLRNILSRHSALATLDATMARVAFDKSAGPTVACRAGAEDAGHPALASRPTPARLGRGGPPAKLLAHDRRAEPRVHRDPAGPLGSRRLSLRCDHVPKAAVALGSPAGRATASESRRRGPRVARAGWPASSARAASQPSAPPDLSKATRAIVASSVASAWRERMCPKAQRRLRTRSVKWGA